MDSLYRQTISSVVGNFKTLNGDWKCCPDKIVFDVVIELYRKELFDLLTPILKDSQIFCRLLKARTNFHFYRTRVRSLAKRLLLLLMLVMRIVLATFVADLAERYGHKT